MKVTNKQNSHLIIDDFFTQSELVQIWEELDSITNAETLLPPEKTATATQDGKPIKHNHGVFLDDLFSDSSSKIVQCFDKFYSTDLYQIFPTMGNEFRHMFSVNFDRNLVSYYETNDYYKPHIDGALFTCIWWGYKEPKGFVGGDFELWAETKVDIPLQNNRLLVFPSYLAHAVTPVNMIGNREPFNGYGRYSISKFLFVQPTIGK